MPHSRLLIICLIHIRLPSFTLTPALPSPPQQATIQVTERPQRTHQHTPRHGGGQAPQDTVLASPRHGGGQAA